MNINHGTLPTLLTKGDAKLFQHLIMLDNGTTSKLFVPLPAVFQELLSNVERLLHILGPFTTQIPSHSKIHQLEDF